MQENMFISPEQLHILVRHRQSVKTNEPLQVSMHSFTGRIDKLHRILIISAVLALLCVRKRLVGVFGKMKSV
ncbi:uncharacterized protein PHALS_03182 [Plasmopara halstedii]|uniref:Uncharacterized protein n=1 Tax=Plasmopara halstedii TaxID=4781 RepID=A0A0P1A457_PLAHL|nr:uncharacterized protein PHALS_03182 [Plasmopara halstedii]CEG35212.1 hypothetical protein PHALS_03182 [Plasmopara halstedii]|eukprot:XP_024571581.1 hypothetical protein PHALS_03182 [Plasmopara halstedii]